MSDQQIEVVTLEALRVQSGEVLVLRVPTHCTQAVIAQISEAVEELGLEGRARIVHGDIELAVVERELVVFPLPEKLTDDEAERLRQGMAAAGVIEVARPLEGFTLPPAHPMAGREAWQCVTCEGIFYPERVPPVVCPYCAEDAEED